MINMLGHRVYYRHYDRDPNRLYCHRYQESGPALEAVLRFTVVHIESSVPWEVVVVDNGPTDETLLRGATTQGGAVGEPRTLVKEGFAVSASILAWSPPHRRVLDMVDRGIDIWFRPQEYSLQKRAWRINVAQEQLRNSRGAAVDRGEI